MKILLKIILRLLYVVFGFTLIIPVLIWIFTGYDYIDVNDLIDDL